MLSRRSHQAGAGHRAPSADSRPFERTKRGAAGQRANSPHPGGGPETGHRLGAPERLGAAGAGGMTGGEFADVLRVRGGDLRLDPAPCWNRAGNAIAVPGIAPDDPRQMFVIEVAASAPK